MGLTIFLKKTFGFESPETEYEHLISWVNNQGGISSILDNMDASGFRHIVASWRADGNHLSVDGNSILAIIGSAALRPLADKCNTDVFGAANLIAKFLPLISETVQLEKKDSENNPTKLA